MAANDRDDFDCKGTGSDDLHELLIAARLKMDWTPLQDAVADAGAEQIDAAMQEAERYDDRTRFPLLNNETVRAKVRDTLDAMRAVRALGSEAETFVAPQEPATSAFGSTQTLPQYFDPDDPESYRGLFGLVVGRPDRVHVLRGGYTPANWIMAELGSGVGCGWRGPDCLDFTRTGLTFSCGQHLVLVPTCHSCGPWLLAGGADAYQTPA
ncbi:hypothetical protein [Mycolicibacterium brisbanense]|uniref:Phage tail protein I n=1 Tax=Mycolicibacterium brisbanense TaxID=146020 RepID=A0A100W0Q6_9MYCO|nr:hypothetical protein [Mycolicibacterium brisbanense]MCV7161863.1 hypothetical protein [Mycolicibacterium brisbanense]GAS89376.1 phage tail protein I [Mycolicibacterium brisbanense]